MKGEKKMKIEELRTTRLAKILQFATHPVSVRDIAEATGFHHSYVRYIISENQRDFMCIRQEKWQGKIKFWQGATVLNVQDSTETQVIYHNPYHQLTREPDFIPRQHGQVNQFS